MGGLKALEARHEGVQVIYIYIYMYTYTLKYTFTTIYIYIYIYIYILHTQTHPVSPRHLGGLKALEARHEGVQDTDNSTVAHV